MNDTERQNHRYPVHWGRRHNPTMTRCNGNSPKLFRRYKIGDADDVDTECPESTKKAIQLDLELRVTTFTVIPGDGTEP